MNKVFDLRTVLALLGGALVIVVLSYILRPSRPARVSAFGEYRGYSTTLYDGTQRTSDYLTLSNGTRLAYDLILPTQKGIPASQPLPVLFKYTPYGRCWTIFDRNGKLLIGGKYGVDIFAESVLRIRYMLNKQSGRLLDPLFRDRWLGELVKHGYAIVSVERPGTGASFGKPTNAMEDVAKEENEILNWIASQPWSDGNIGMYGDSWQAMVQFTAASTGNSHLKAIFPAASQIEIYDALEFPGGVYNKGFNDFAAEAIDFLDTLATPVDRDVDGKLLAQALKERQDAKVSQSLAKVSKIPYRDSRMPDGENLWIDHMDLYPFIDRINRSHTAVYLTVGWYDVFTADMFYWYASLTTPRHLTVRPTDHSNVDENGSDLKIALEAERWFDYWLKGIDNGIMSEAPIHYYLQGVPAINAWQTSTIWPLENQELSRFYFDQGKTGSVASVNDGFLTAKAPASPKAADAYRVDYTTSTGTHSRWTAIEEAHAYANMSSNDAKGLTYTTSPLETDLEVTGHPVAHLWLSTEAPDLDAFIYLEKVDPNGKSTYVTEGDLRLTHRKPSQAPFNNLGLPYHAHLESDVETIQPGKPVELAFSLLPSAYQFHKGDRMRITITFADAGTFETPILNPAPTLSLIRDSDCPSYVEIPVAHR